MSVKGKKPSGRGKKELGAKRARKANFEKV
jgi:hypothetical protein